MPSREFLQDYPLYRKFELVLSIERHEWSKPTINAPCSLCGGVQTFGMVGDYHQWDEQHPLLPGSSLQYPYSDVIRLNYRCAGCQKSMRYFLVRAVAGSLSERATRNDSATKNFTLTKVGQFPPWEITPDSATTKHLGDSVETLKKGLICESQGYGIAAFAYCRRLVEEMIDQLLEDLRAVVDPAQEAEYSEALKRAAQSYRAADKVEQIKDLLPASLRPGGINPLAVLHQSLSKGLHGRTDEDCLEIAQIIRESTLYLLVEVQRVRARGEEFAARLQTLARTNAAQKGE